MGKKTDDKSLEISKDAKTDIQVLLKELFAKDIEDMLKNAISEPNEKLGTVVDNIRQYYTTLLEKFDKVVSKDDKDEIGNWIDTSLIPFLNNNAKKSDVNEIKKYFADEGIVPKIETCCDDLLNKTQSCEGKITKIQCITDTLNNVPTDVAEIKATLSKTEPFVTEIKGKSDKLYQIIVGNDSDISKVQSIVDTLDCVSSNAKDIKATLSEIEPFVTKIKGKSDKLYQIIDGYDSDMKNIEKSLNSIKSDIEKGKRRFIFLISGITVSLLINIVTIIMMMN